MKPNFEEPKETECQSEDNEETIKRGVVRSLSGKGSDENRPEL